MSSIYDAFPLPLKAFYIFMKSEWEEITGIQSQEAQTITNLCASNIKRNLYSHSGVRGYFALCFGVFNNHGPENKQNSTHADKKPNSLQNRNSIRAQWKQTRENFTKDYNLEVAFSRFIRKIIFIIKYSYSAWISDSISLEESKNWTDYSA
jgi:hypothetical protein